LTPSRLKLSSTFRRNVAVPGPCTSSTGGCLRPPPASSPSSSPLPRALGAENFLFMPPGEVLPVDFSQFVIRVTLAQQFHELLEELELSFFCASRRPRLRPPRSASKNSTGPARGGSVRAHEILRRLAVQRQLVIVIRLQPDLHHHFPLAHPLGLPVKFRERRPTAAERKPLRAHVAVELHPHLGDARVHVSRPVVGNISTTFGARPPCPPLVLLPRRGREGPRYRFECRTVLALKFCAAGQFSDSS